MFNGLRAELRPAARALYDEARRRGWAPRVTSVYRSRALQARLYRRWRAGRLPFPAAPPGTSLHEYGLAFDLVVRWLDDQTVLGRLWKSWGGRWYPSDAVHFEAAVR